MLAYFSHFLVAANSATSPAPRAATETYESAKVLITVTSHASNLPACQGICVAPSGRLPSCRIRPMGSLIARTPADAKARVTKSFSCWCLAILLDARLQARPCRPSSSSSSSIFVYYNVVRRIATPHITIVSNTTEYKSQ